MTSIDLEQGILRLFPSEWKSHRFVGFRSHYARTARDLSLGSFRFGTSTSELVRDYVISKALRMRHVVSLVHYPNLERVHLDFPVVLDLVRRPHT